MTNLQLLSIVPSAVALLIFSGIHLTSANKTVPCDQAPDICKDFEFCDLSTRKCTPDNGDCASDPCPYGFYCNDYGKCIKDTPCDMPCEEGQECYLEQVQCFTDPCPPQPACRPKKCAQCADGEVCENGECVLDSKCASVLCSPDTYCYKGACLRQTECAGQCGPAERCYEGSEVCAEPPCPTKTVCKFDKCAVIRCASGYKCENDGCVLDPTQLVDPSQQ